MLKKLLKYLSCLLVLFGIFFIFHHPQVLAKICDFSANSVSEGCTLDLGDNPITTGNWVNNGSVIVGKGTWTIRGSFTQNQGADLTMSASLINLSSGTLTIADTNFEANRSDVDNELVVAIFESKKSDKCKNFKSNLTVIRNPNGPLKISSDCSFNRTAIIKQNYLVPGLTALAIPFVFWPTIQNIFFSVSGPLDLWHLILRWLTNLLNSLGFRRKRKYWGTVYDSVSKQPLDPVLVRLLDAKTGKIVEQAISDLYGHFGFLVRPGEFTITAEKNGYAYPSKKIIGSKDEIFDHLYHGEILTIKDKSELVTPNIPMDRLRYDFNQEAKKKIIRFRPWLNWSVYIIMNVLFWIGLVSAVINFVIDHRPLDIFLLIVYVLLLAYKLFWPQQRLWGFVRSKLTHKPLVDLVLQISHPGLEQIIIAKTKTAIDGKYFLKSQPGTYVLTIKPLNSTAVFLSKEVVIGKNAVLNEEFNI